MFRYILSVSLDASGNIYAGGLDRLDKLTPDGGFVGSIGSIAGTISGGPCDGATGWTPGWCTGGIANTYGAFTGPVYDPDEDTIYAIGSGMVVKHDGLTGAFVGWAGEVAQTPPGGTCCLRFSRGRHAHPDLVPQRRGCGFFAALEPRPLDHRGRWRLRLRGRYVDSEGGEALQARLRPAAGYRGGHGACSRCRSASSSPGHGEASPASPPVTLGGVSTTAALTLWSFLGLESATLPDGERTAVLDERAQFPNTGPCLASRDRGSPSANPFLGNRPDGRSAARQCVPPALGHERRVLRRAQLTDLEHARFPVGVQHEPDNPRGIGLSSFLQSLGRAKSWQSAQLPRPRSSTQVRTEHQVAFVFSLQPGHLPARCLWHAPQYRPQAAMSERIDVDGFRRAWPRRRQMDREERRARDRPQRASW